MFWRGSSSWICIATVSPFLVIGGVSNFFSRMTFRPLGPRVVFIVSARELTPRRSAARESMPYMTSLGMDDSHGNARALGKVKRMICQQYLILKLTEAAKRNRAVSETIADMPQCEGRISGSPNLKKSASRCALVCSTRDLPSIRHQD